MSCPITRPAVHYMGEIALSLSLSIYIYIYLGPLSVSRVKWMVRPKG